MKPYSHSVLAAALAVSLLAACKPDTAPSKNKGKASPVLGQNETSGDLSGEVTHARNQGGTPTFVRVEVRPDGLAYSPESSSPFTGDAVELHMDRNPPTIAKRIPYVAGKKHGAVTSYTPGGRKREERRYENGRPVSSDVYYSNGKKKIEVLLNEKDLAEGPYKRWHDNGALEAEATFDADELFHGIEKDYDREGKLVGHYRKEHGVLVEVIFETPEMTKVRFEKGSLLPTEKPTK